MAFYPCDNKYYFEPIWISFGRINAAGTPPVTRSTSVNVTSYVDDWRNLTNNNMLLHITRCAGGEAGTTSASWLYGSLSRSYNATNGLCTISLSSSIGGGQYDANNFIWIEGYLVVVA